MNLSRALLKQTDCLRMRAITAKQTAFNRIEAFPHEAILQFIKIEF